MGPAHLSDLYRSTRLNFHPATYDAYGMTIVEAASQVRVLVGEGVAWGGQCGRGRGCGSAGRGGAGRRLVLGGTSRWSLGG